MSIRFVKMELREVRIPFRFTFRHAKAARDAAHKLIVAMHTDGGHVGYGEILPRAYLTGETLDSAWRDAGRLWWKGFRELDFPEENPPTELLRQVYLLADAIRKTASYAGVEIAAIDAWARATGRPGRALLAPAESSPAPALLTAPIGAISPRDAAWAARVLRWLGFRHFKVKMGDPADLERVRAVRRVVGKKRDLRVDANGAWTVDEALRMADVLRPLAVDCLEQPVEAGDPDALARVQREGGIPVMADESLCTREDAEALVLAGAADFWNLRLAKVGGYAGLLEMRDMASTNGIRLHLGVLVGESSVLAAAERACLGAGDFAYVEYGFPRVLLKGDPFRGGPGGYRGIGAPLDDAPGLGVRPLLHALDRVTLRSEIFD